MSPLTIGVAQPNFSAPSLRDQMIFDALPDETKAAIARLYGPQASSDAVAAYEMGWEDALDEASVHVPPPPRKDQIKERIDRRAA